MSETKDGSSKRVNIDDIDGENSYANVFPPAYEIQEAIASIAAVNDDEAILSMGLCAGDTSTIDEHTPNDVKRSAYLKLMLQVNPYNESFQLLVNALENATSRTMQLEADSSSKLSNSLSSSSKTMSAVSAKSTASSIGTYLLLKRSNDNCHRTKVCCPRCLKGWGEGEKNSHFYNYLMTGLAAYPCEKCKLIFGASSAVHKCPFCKSFVLYDMENYHSKIRCTNKACDKEFGFYIFPDCTEKQVADLKRILSEKRNKIKDSRDARNRKLAKGMKEHSVGTSFLRPLKDVCPVCSYDFERNVENIGETQQLAHLYSCVVRRNEMRKAEQCDRKDRLSRGEYPDEKKEAKKEVFVSKLFENVRAKKTQAVMDEVAKYPNSVFAMDGNANTALILASKEGCDELIEFLIENGSNINHLNDSKYTPLIYCCVNGNVKGISLLLNKGVNVNFVGRFGNTAFLHAAMNSHLDAVALLLTKRSNASSRAGVKASAKGLPSPDENTVDINSVNKTGLSALLFAINEKNFPLTKYLIQNDANIHQKDLAGNSSLIVACSYHDESIVHMLIEKGASVADCNNNGYTPFMVACEHGNMRIIESIYKTGKVKNINEVTKVGNTALILACRFGHLDVVKWLVASCKADVKVRNKENLDATYYAWRCFHPEIAHYLLELGISAKFDAPKRTFKPRL